MNWQHLYGISIILILILSSCGNAAANLPPRKIPLLIMVGGLNKQIYLPHMLTRKLGYFDQEGLAVTLIDEASGQSAVDSVLAGQVNAGSGAYSHTIVRQAAGEQLKCVVQLVIAPGEAEIVSSKEAGRIRSVKDLKGKKLGITEPGSGTHTLTIALLHKAGITPDQVQFVSVGAGDTFIAAMQQGRIDAGMTTEPTISRLLASGAGNILVDLRTPQTTEAALDAPYPFICVFMRSEYVAENKDVVQKLANAYVRTLNWIQEHTAEQIADQMPVEYYAGNKNLYVMALQNQRSIFSADGSMIAGGPQSVLTIEQQTNKTVQGKQIDLNETYTNEFVINAASLTK